MTTNELYPDHRPDDADNAHETDAPGSRVARAWDALEQIHDRVAELTPEASEQEIAAQVGDYIADTLLHDADQAAADDLISSEEAELLRHDSTEVLLQGGVEDDLSIPLDENPITDVTEAGRDSLLKDAVTEISRDDAELGTEAAILLGRAQEHIDRTKLNVPSRSEQPNEEDGTPSAAEAPPVEVMQAYLDRLDVDYHQRLAELFSSCLHRLNAEELAFVRGDEDLRNKMAYALLRFGIDRDSPEIGEYYENPFHPNDPQIVMRAMELEARAIQVNASFQAQAAEIARATNSLHLPGPVKDARRIAEKMEKDYSNEHGVGETDVDFLASRVKDAVRCRLVIRGDPTTGDETVIDQIKRSNLTIAEDRHHHPLIKRSFRDRLTGEPLTIESGTNYRDTKVTVTITVEMLTRDGEATLCEIAIVTPEMAVATVSEHPIYEITRSLQGDKRPIAARLDAYLKEIQTAFYGDVSQQIANRLADNPS